jgi:EAL domain-containing protein (putative c-di-GMP-specific phosphodiesterase class I)
MVENNCSSLGNKGRADTLPALFHLVLRIPQTTSPLCMELSDQQLVGAPEKLKIVTRILKEAGILIAIDTPVLVAILLKRCEPLRRIL